MFDKILIANRGEIACRIMATARRLGVKTVAVYSAADANARHVALADEAVAIGPAPAVESYLVGARIIEAALATGAQAVHPGYGFLSENAEFAEACAAAGLVFIGPPPAAIRAMGLKGAAKALMEQARVPVVPGYHGDDQSPDVLLRHAKAIGWPVLIKAVAGGGGKGMRRADAAEDFPAALAGAQREAAAAFGDDKVLLEKYLIKPRHIEIQIFADSHGNVVHLFERDCSVQRRHQKVIEEAPAPKMPLALREAMGQAALAAVKAIGYVGAGTIEFIADVSNGLRADRFYFMEMNTRLQVEHPVTELITGQDLVAWQLLVASGEKLPHKQGELAISGHAVEARIYAEDPAHDFLPSTGRLLRLRAPAEDRFIRVETGVREGDTVTPYYDPMIAKLVAWDHDRASALRRLVAALGQYEIAGVTTNTDFLAAVARHPAFQKGDIDTGFIGRFQADLLPAPGGTLPASVLALATLHILLTRATMARQAAARSTDPTSPWHNVDGWRLNHAGHDVLHFLDGEQDLAVRVGYLPNGYRLDLPGGICQVASGELVDGALIMTLDGVRQRGIVVAVGDGLAVRWQGRDWRLTLPARLTDADADEGGLGALIAPMPGRIVQVMVEAGTEVVKGKALIILEAMKMEHTISAPRDGLVERVSVQAGDQVPEGTVLLAFAETPE